MMERTTVSGDFMASVKLPVDGKNVKLPVLRALHFSRRLAALQISPSATAVFKKKQKELPTCRLCYSQQVTFSLMLRLRLSNLRTVEAQMGCYSGECGNGLGFNPRSRHHVFWRGREFLLDCRLS
jgi:hypothetical protein